MNKVINASDRLAVALSFLCVLHCIAMPLALIVLPSVTGMLALNGEEIHLWLVFVVIPVSLFAAISGYKHHKRLNVLLISVVGLSILVTAVMFGHDLLDGKGEVVLTLLGSFIIAFGHISNLRLRRAKSLGPAVN